MPLLCRVEKYFKVMGDKMEVDGGPSPRCHKCCKLCETNGICKILFWFVIYAVELYTIYMYIHGVHGSNQHKCWKKGEVGKMNFDIFIGPSPIIALPWKSLHKSEFLLNFVLFVFSKLLHGFLYVARWICQNWEMDFSELLHGFVKIEK